MTRRRAVMIGALALVAALAIVTFTTRSARVHASSETHRVELANGIAIEGRIVPLQPGEYLIQSSDESLIVSTGDMRRIDGEPMASHAIPASGDAVFVQETFEDVGPSGAVEVHSVLVHRNDGQRVVASLSWGLAPHEERFLSSYRLVDAFGNELSIEVTDRSGGGKRLRAALPRPILPGETMRATSIYLDEESVWPEQDGTWVYRNAGDYPDNRLVTRSVLLPAGAEILSVTPEPLHRLESGGRWLVVWRRYFARGEMLPWEVRWSLPS